MNINPNVRRQEIAVNICFWVILLAGLYLRFYQYLMGRSLWEDEAHIALNFIYRGYKDLALPLENYQTAPIFFLWSVETFSRLFGVGEKALRAFPFIISIISLPFFYFFVRDITKSKLTALIAFLIFSLNISFIYYSSEIKSYIVDVDFYILIGYLLFSEQAVVKKHRALLLSVIGCLALLYSNVSVVVLFCTALYLISTWRMQKEKDTFEVGIPKKDVAVFLVWVLVFAINFFLFIYHHPYGDGMKQIWKDRFAPMNVLSPEFSSFMSMRIDDSVFSELLFFTKGVYFPYVLIALLAIAFANIIYTKRYRILLFTVLPIALHLIMSMLKLYPFFYRFILYLLPGFIVLVSIGTAVSAKFIAKKAHMVAAVPVVAYCCYCCVIISMQKFPRWELEIKPAIDYVNKNYPNKRVIITTPFTCYLYYMETNYAKNKRLTAVPWWLSASDYYNNDVIKSIDSNYVLFHSIDGYIDGYQDVLRDLNEKKLIVRQFQYKTYAVSEVKPLSSVDSNINKVP